MCGRFAQAVPLGKLKMMNLFDEIDSDYMESFNVAPSDFVSVVSLRDGRRILSCKKWGLVPSWSKDVKIGNRLINARGESLREKPSFKNAFRGRRCLIPVTGFYEWRSDGGVKKPYFIFMKKNNKEFTPMLLAGLYDSWGTADGQILETFTVITTSSCDKLKIIHDRMPVIIPEVNIEKWFSSTLPSGEIDKLLKPVPDDMIEFYPVSELVNSPQNNSEKCMERL